MEVDELAEGADAGDASIEMSNGVQN